MENNRPKLVSLSSRLREPIALCDTAKVIVEDEDESGDDQDNVNDNGGDDEDDEGDVDDDDGDDQDDVNDDGKDDQRQSPCLTQQR